MNTPPLAGSEADLRKWANINYIPFTPINPTWNSIIQDECRSMNNVAAVRRLSRLDRETGPVSTAKVIDIEQELTNAGWEASFGVAWIDPVTKMPYGTLTAWEIVQQRREQDKVAMKVGADV